MFPQRPGRRFCSSLSEFQPVCGKGLQSVHRLAVQSGGTDLSSLRGSNKN